jgi:23S rRNA pseudouridine1911/1915/1917 synthase
MDIHIDSKYQSMRVDKLIEQELLRLGYKQSTRSMIKDDISNGCSVNDGKVKPSYKLKQGDVLNIDESFWKTFFENKDLSEDIVAQKGDINVIYEDNDILVIFKPKNLVVHPGVGNKEGTLANYLKYYLDSKNELDINMDRVGIVHRLDKGVSGIMVVAKNKESQDKLKKQFSERSVDKMYLANVEKFKESELVCLEEIDLDKILDCMRCEDINYDTWFNARGYIGRDHVNRFKMEFKLYEFGGSKQAQSYILPISKDKMLIKIVTGRMHQIRATLYYYGYHILGDDLYNPGSREVSSTNIMLQSIYLSFTHPITKERLYFTKT